MTHPDPDSIWSVALQTHNCTIHADERLRHPDEERENTGLARTLRQASLAGEP